MEQKNTGMFVKLDAWISWKKRAHEEDKTEERFAVQRYMCHGLWVVKAMIVKPDAGSPQSGQFIRNALTQAPHLEGTLPDDHS